jgi:hypothetical protein
MASGFDWRKLLGALSPRGLRSIIEFATRSLFCGSDDGLERELRCFKWLAAHLLSDTAATIIDYSQGGIYYDGAYQDEVAPRAFVFVESLPRTASNKINWRLFAGRRMGADGMKTAWLEKR